MSQALSNNTHSLNTTITNYFTISDDRSDILAWLSPLDPGLRHHDIRDRRVENVGKWVLQTDEFKSWYASSGEGESDNAVLFCYGDPGVGKTFISSLVIDNLCDQAKGQNVAVTCFYFDYAAQKEQSLTSILGTILKQAISGLEKVPEEISQAYEDQKKPIGGRRPLLSDIVKMLQITSSKSRTFICIDALDECVAGDRVKLLDSLCKILEESPGARIFVTGRPHIQAEIGKRLAGRIITIPITPRRDDIVGYLRIRLREDTTPDAMDSNLEADILKKVPDNISEIFLLVSLSIDAILQETTIHRRRQKLSAMTDGLGLGGAYAATLDRIKGQGREKARLGIAASMWISHSERPLRVDELCHALGVDIGSPNLNIDNTPSIATLLACCQGLVAVDKKTSIIRLIHFTLHEYLRAHPELFGAAHSAIAETCLTYLNSQQVKALSTSPSPNLRGMPFLEYSSLYWGVHAKRDLSDCAKVLARKLFDDYNNHISTKLFMEAQGPGLHTINSNTPSLFSSLHCASAFGIVEIVTGLVEVEDCNINQKDCVGNTPLILAAHNGHEAVVKILLGRDDILPDEPGGLGQTPLCSAAGNGHEEVVKILLERDDINRDKPDKYGQTPLFRAAWNGHKEIMKILLGQDDINPNQPDNNGNNPNLISKISKDLQPRADTDRDMVVGHISGDHSGNSHSFNTNVTNNYSGLDPQAVPETFGELLAGNRWGVSRPEIDLDYLSDPHNMPENGTGEWIFEQDWYKEWWDSEKSELLWLCGGPGTGKTMLAKRIAAKFLQGPGDPPGGVKFAYHFTSPEPPIGKTSADEAGSRKLKLAKVAWDLLYGILHRDGSLFGGCKTELGIQGDKFFTNPSSLWKVLRNAIKDRPTDTVYILIDGIDGLNGDLCEELVGRILELMKIGRVKILLSSRDVIKISNSLCGGCTKINIDKNDSVRRDLETVIRHKVNAFGGWNHEQRVGAIKTLLERSEGSFLWASLAVENLHNFCPGGNYEPYLRKLPRRLEDLYEKMICDVQSPGIPEEVLKTIQSVALALRPLTFGELGYILACMEEGRAETRQQRSRRRTSIEIQPRTEEKIRQYVQSSLSFLRASATTVSIVHHTAREYLLGRDILQGPPKSELDLAVSWECFRYLHRAIADLEKPTAGSVRVSHIRYRVSSSNRDRRGGPAGAPPEKAQKSQQAQDKWPYLRYAAEFWFIHARRSIEIAEHKFTDDPTHNWLQYQFFDTSDIIRKPWIELCGDPKMQLLAGYQTPLHIAACLGLTPLVEKALLGFEAGSKDSTYSGQINKKNIFGDTPLHLAFQFDWPDVVELLAMKQADRTIKNNGGVTAFELGAILGRGYSLDILKQAHMVPDTNKEIVEETVEETADGVAEETLDELGNDTAEGTAGGVGVDTGDIRVGESEAIIEPSNVPLYARVGIPLAFFLLYRCIRNPSP